jgi:hypothetical protein
VLHARYAHKKLKSIKAFPIHSGPPIRSRTGHTSLASYGSSQLCLQVLGRSTSSETLHLDGRPPFMGAFFWLEHMKNGQSNTFASNIEDIFFFLGTQDRAHTTFGTVVNSEF